MIDPDYARALERARAKVEAHADTGAFSCGRLPNGLYRARAIIDGHFEDAVAPTAEDALRRAKDQMVRALALREPRPPEEPELLAEILAAVRETNALVKQLLGGRS